MFLVMGVSTVIFTMMAFKAAHEKRTFFFCACYITAVCSFAYYAMLSGQAWLITTNCRQFFYVRFLEWAATTPLILLVLPQPSDKRKEITYTEEEKKL
jgi:bacteriorhodopsin